MHTHTHTHQNNRLTETKYILAKKFAYVVFDQTPAYVIIEQIIWRKLSCRVWYYTIQCIYVGRRRSNRLADNKLKNKPINMCNSVSAYKFLSTYTHCVWMCAASTFLIGGTSTNNIIRFEYANAFWYTLLYMLQYIYFYRYIASFSKKWMLTQSVGKRNVFFFGCAHESFQAPIFNNIVEFYEDASCAFLAFQIIVYTRLWTTKFIRVQ